MRSRGMSAHPVHCMPGQYGIVLALTRVRLGWLVSGLACGGVLPMPDSQRPEPDSCVVNHLSTIVDMLYTWTIDSIDYFGIVHNVLRESTR